MAGSRADGHCRAETAAHSLCREGQKAGAMGLEGCQVKPRGRGRLADPSLLVGNLSCPVSRESLSPLESFPVGFTNLEDSPCRRLNWIPLSTMEGCAKGSPQPRCPCGDASELHLPCRLALLGPPSAQVLCTAQQAAQVLGCFPSHFLPFIWLNFKVIR